MSFYSTKAYSTSPSMLSGTKTLSVYGGAGGRGTRISSSNAGLLSRGGSFNLADGLDLHVSANEKATMQSLNDRLASYLEKVRSLEMENARLEKQIREWYESRTVVTHDLAGFYATIEDLKRKIHLASSVNAKTVLDIDNAKLAADDFKMKFDNEQSMRLAVEADIAGLRRVLDELNLNRSDLEMQYEALNDEKITMRRNHDEEMAHVRTQIGGQVNVEVDAAPSMDLNQAMAEIREHYEAVAAKNRRDLDVWYQGKVATVEQEVVQQNESLLISCTELKELKSTLQRLQIELQSHHSMKASLEGTLADTQASYAARLAGLQQTVTSLEEQLTQIHANIANNRLAYDQLLDLKTRLEMEIAEYRRLLDGEESSSQVVTKVITVVQTVVDGKVVESTKSVEVDVDEIEPQQ
ncbi:keratin, type I cytoskeletal 13-like [Megalops cyprinoides]|uniref:keratin, type I cytoskeletal 13-like n=1 Tax=Megalops cyprinoides TaxID=118141 RepID=UPI00186438CE|nr:keratin, type I cytoskeletal 13-like [Megalops cyprinoides]